MSLSPPPSGAAEHNVEELTAKAQRASILLKALSHETRLIILFMLAKREKTVTEIEGLLGLQQAVVSQHLARLRADMTLERLHGEKPIRHGQCPSRNHWQNWIGLKHEAYQAIWDRGREQLLDGFPKRTDVHGCVQAEQRLFQ